MKLRGITEDPERKARFGIRYQDPEGKYRREWFETLAEAQTMLELRRQQVANGTFRPERLGRWSKAKQKPCRPGNQSRLVSEVIDEVLAESLATLRDKRQDRRFANEWKRELGTRTLEEVQAADILRWRRRVMAQPCDKTGRPLTPGTINKYTTFLSKVFTYAVDNGYTTHHPARSTRRGKGGFKKLDDQHKEDAVLLVEQQAMLHQVMTPNDYRIVVLAIETGLRQGNLFGMRREWVDLERRAVRVPGESFKGKRWHLVRLNATAVKLLRQMLSEHDSEWLMPSARKGSGHIDAMAWYRKHWKPAVEKAGLKGLKFHALRATCATRMFEAGATVEEVRQQLGHATVTMVMRYARVVESHRSDVLERMSLQSQAAELHARSLESNVSDSVSENVVEIRKSLQHKELRKNA